MRVQSALFALTVSLLIPVVYAGPAVVSGVPRFVVVNDRLARGGQPSGGGFRSLAAAGYRTIVDLQEKGERSRDEKHLVEALGMKYVNVPMRGMKTPEDKQISRVLKALQKDKTAPYSSIASVARTGPVSCWQSTASNTTAGPTATRCRKPIRQRAAS